MAKFLTSHKMKLTKAIETCQQNSARAEVSRLPVLVGAVQRTDKTGQAGLALGKVH